MKELANAGCRNISEANPMKHEHVHDFIGQPGIGVVGRGSGCDETERRMDGEDLLARQISGRDVEFVDDHVISIFPD